MTGIIPKRIRTAASVLLGRTQLKTNRGPIPPISEEEAAEARSFFPLKKFFVFGSARSGTTLLSRLINVHPQVLCNWQAHFFSRPPLLKSLVNTPEVEEWLRRDSNRWNRGKDLSPVVLRAAADYILEREARRAGKCIVGDKSPNSYSRGQAVRNMHDVYPDGTILHIIRDGRHAVLSRRFQFFMDNESQLTREDKAFRSGFIADPESYLSGKRSLFGEEKMHFVARQWAETVNETDREGRRLYGDRYLSLRYEDLLANPWQEMQRLWEFLGAGGLDRNLQQAMETEMQSNTSTDWQREKNHEVMQAMQKYPKATWQAMFTARDREIFKEEAGQVLVDWHYEKDLNW